MWSSDSDSDREEAAPSSPAQAQQHQQPSTPPSRRRHRARRRAHRRARTGCASAGAAEEEQPPVEAEAEDVWRGLQRQREAWPRRASRPVVVAAGEDEEASPDAPASAGAISREGSGAMGRARSLTDDDLEELKGCVDLGFGFGYHEIPELCGTLPALELCYSMTQRFRDEHHHQLGRPEDAPAPPAPAPASPAHAVATNWKISSPGDSPDEVKARLKYWAQAVACTVKLCS